MHGPGTYVPTPTRGQMWSVQLSYLKADRKNLLIPEDAQDETVRFSLTPPSILN